MPHSHEILEHVHQITLQREEDMLTCSLLESVEKVLQTDTCLKVSLKNDGYFLNCARIVGGKFSVSASPELFDAQLFDLVSEMLMKGDESVKTMLIDGVSGGVKLIFRSDDICQFLVFTRSLRFRPNELRVLSGMISIYTSFQTLLNESQIDQLTGLANRKTFDSVASTIFDSDDHKRSRGQVADEKRGVSQPSERVWLAMLDVDDFKRVNDQYGHLYGDEILINIANIIKDSFRYEDHKFRFGGEEFVVLLTARDEKACQLTLERMLNNVREYQFPSDLPITLSIGAVELKEDVFYVTAIDCADKALYHSKREGKDRITFYQSLLDSNLVDPPKTQAGSLDLF